jgi:hypothetical protein
VVVAFVVAFVVDFVVALLVSDQQPRESKQQLFCFLVVVGR